MIHYKNRFHGHGSLKYVYKNGTVVRGSLFTLKTSYNQRRKSSRVAVVVSKKVLKSAVGRNRIRRRLYEQLRAELPSVVTADIVCIVTSSDVRELPTSALHETLRARISEAGLYKIPS